MGIAKDQDLPLEGLRVLELSHTVMGPTAGLLLADLGADVVKVEPAPDGDATRRLPGFAIGFFGYLNRNKRSLVLDLKTEDGRALVHRLAADADVVVENYGPGTMERLGCGYEQLAALNPRLVYLALKGFLSGPYEKRPALDEVVQFMAGLAYMTGPPGQPLRAGASVIDILGGVFGVVAALAALQERAKAGRGQLVRSALFESTAFLVGQHMAGQAMTGEEPPPMPARRGAWAVYQTFATADGEQLFLGITSNNHFGAFCEARGQARGPVRGPPFAGERRPARGTDAERCPHPAAAPADRARRATTRAPPPAAAPRRAHPRDPGRPRPRRGRDRRPRAARGRGRRGP